MSWSGKCCSTRCSTHCGCRCVTSRVFGSTSHPNNYQLGAFINMLQDGLRTESESISWMIFVVRLAQVGVRQGSRWGRRDNRWVRKCQVTMIFYSSAALHLIIFMRQQSNIRQSIVCSESLLCEAKFQYEFRLQTASDHTSTQMPALQSSSSNMQQFNLLQRRGNTL